MDSSTLETKVCPRCKNPKLLSEFGWRNKAKGKLQVYCNSCRHTYDQNHQKSNPDLYVARNQRARERLRAWVASLKSGPCVDCHNIFPPCVMDFDHRSGKVSNISLMVTQCKSRASILEEISKCDLVCSNCHRIRTCKQQHRHALNV